MKMIKNNYTLFVIKPYCNILNIKIMILIYIIWVIMILIPIIGAVSCFINRNKKEHKEIDVFIRHKDK